MGNPPLPSNYMQIPTSLQDPLYYLTPCQSNTKLKNQRSQVEQNSINKDFQLSNEKIHH